MDNSRIFPSSREWVSPSGGQRLRSLVTDLLVPRDHEACMRVMRGFDHPISMDHRRQLIDPALDVQRHRQVISEGCDGGKTRLSSRGSDRSSGRPVGGTRCVAISSDRSMTSTVTMSCRPRSH